MIEVKLAYLPSVLPGRHERMGRGAVVGFRVWRRDGCWRVALGLGTPGQAARALAPSLPCTSPDTCRGLGQGGGGALLSGTGRVRLGSGLCYGPEDSDPLTPPSLAVSLLCSAPVGNTRGLSLGLRPRSILSRVLSVDAEASCPLPRSRVQVSSHGASSFPLELTVSPICKMGLWYFS